MHKPVVLAALAAALALAPFGRPQSATPPVTVRKATTKSPTATVNRSTSPTPLTNRDIIRLVDADISDEIIIGKIKISKTRFDISVDGLIGLREAGVSDRVVAVMINPATDIPPAAPASQPAEFKPGSTASNAGYDAAPGVSTLAKTPLPVGSADPSQAPQTYGLYVQENGELKPLGRIQTKVQISKFRTIVKGWVPFMRERMDINIPGAHSTSRHEVPRPNFYAYFPPSRDVSTFKLLQAKITGQKLDQRTITNASILFSTEQNQDEVPCDIGPTNVKDLYRISPREDLPSGEFGFVEGSAGSKSTSDIAIIDVWGFAIDRKKDKLPLADYLSTLPAVTLPDAAFLEWTKADCQKIIDDREGKLGITGSMMGWFKRQFESLDVYWADRQFAQAFARLEMLDRQLSPEQANKLAGLLIPASDSQFYVLVSIGTKIGSGRLIGADEEERSLRPFDATLANDKSKDVVPASRLDFIGGYAGLWKVTFDQKSIRGPLTGQDTDLDFEARLNQNLDFKARFPLTWINADP